MKIKSHIFPFKSNFFKEQDPFHLVIVFFIIFFGTAVFFSIPTFYDYKKYNRQIEETINKEFKINMHNLEDISFRFIPSPHLLIKKAKLSLNINDEKLSVLDTENLKIFIPLNSIYNKSNFNMSGLEINNTNFKLGFYRIQLKNQPPIIIVLNPVETDVEIQVNKQNDDNPITVLQSIENTAFHRHKMLLNIYNRIEYLQFQLSFPNDEVLQNMDEYENELKKFIYYSTVSLKDLQTNFSQTYTFDVFEKSMPIVNTVYEERIEQFFDKKAILDSKYLHSPLMFNKINHS